MKKKVVSIFLATALAATALVGCGSSPAEEPTQEAAPSATETAEAETETGTTEGAKATSYAAFDAIDPVALEGTTLNVYTHMSQRVLGEEKKDEAGNTYRDESTAILTDLAKKFEEQYKIKVNFSISQTEADIEPLLQVEDEGVDIFTNPGWSIEKWQAYTEPYFTLEEGRTLYGEYADTMPNDGKYIYSLRPGRAYNNGVVYNETALKSVGYDEVPATLAEFEAMCVKLKEAGITPISLHRVENWPLETFKPFGNYFAGDNVAFDSMLKTDAPFSEDHPVGQTIKQYTDWKAKGFFESEMYTDFGVAMDAVAYGDSAMMLFGSWVVPQIQGRVPEGTDPAAIKFAPAPDFGKGRFITTESADNYSIAKGSKNKDAARLFIEYVADNAQYIADSGFIANKAGVEPIVPELYSLIDEMVEAGKAETMMLAGTTENTLNNEEVLTEANLLADFKWAGNLYDALDITKPEDWAAYDKQVEKQNAAYAEAKEYLGYEWID